MMLIMLVFIVGLIFIRSSAGMMEPGIICKEGHRWVKDKQGLICGACKRRPGNET